MDQQSEGKVVEAGFPVSGGADEKLDYLASNISQTRLLESDRKGDGDPIWRLEKDGSISINAVRVHPALPQGGFRVFAKPLVARIHMLLSRFR